jgi:hypothetical protein
MSNKRVEVGVLTMINKNMDMIKQMEDLFNYEEYVSLCEKNKVKPATKQQFAMGMGSLGMARSYYPDMDWQAAYIKIFKDFSEQDTSKCSDCGNEEKEKFPPIMQQGKNLIRTLKEHVKNKGKLVDNEEYDRRMSACRQCKRFQGKRCLECGCYMETKAYMEAARCELKKW